MPARAEACSAVVDQIRECIGIHSQDVEAALADTDVMLDQQVDQFVAIDERDRGGASREGGFLGAFRKPRGGDDGPADF